MSTTPTASIPQTFALALRHHQAGRLEEAGALYRQILSVQPDHAEALHHLGVIAHQAGHHSLAVEQISQALALHPDNSSALCNLGAALAAEERLDDAVAAYRRALALRPNLPMAENSLGSVLRSRGQLEEAEAAFHRALQLQPHYAEAYSNLGIALAEKGQLDEAVAAFRRAIEIKPRYAAAYNNLGIALARQRLLDEAITQYRLALQFAPGYVDAYINLGAALGRQGLLDEAVASYRQALAIKPDDPSVYNNLGNALKDQGQVEEAIAAFRRAIALKPNYCEAHSNLVYALHFHPALDDATIAEEQQRWNRQFGAPLKRFILPPANDRNPERRLRIGYVSPDFREHTVGMYLRPLFQAHDRAQFEILCYAGVVKPDALTAEFRQRAGHWRDTLGMSDEALAAMVRRDEVDILVDLTLHMAGNRLPVFARQPAPVQVSFAGYTGKTGLEAIGYRISDRYLESEMGDGRSKIGAEFRTPNSELRSAEQILLLDNFWCYDPCGANAAVNALPAQASGRITFGCLNNFCKVNDPLLRLWARVLGQVKDSRLVLLAGAGGHRQRTREVLAREGVEAHRIEFVELRPRPAYLDLYHQLDIALDPFPYHGQATSLDALWMGVPVVSMAGGRAISRAGYSQLSNLGLRELAAFSEDDYVRIATELAGDFPRLATLRTTLRARLEASPLMDAPRFARGIETAYRTMWRCWCEEKRPRK